MNISVSLTVVYDDLDPILIRYYQNQKTVYEVFDNGYDIINLSSEIKFESSEGTR